MSESLEIIREKEEINLDEFEIEAKNSGLIKKIEKVQIDEINLPDIEVKEVVIKETGNFLNLKENVINIPIEMIVFPFFTPQKQNKRVNFKYSFEDLGVTMFCTLVSKDNEDKVFQPSIFEEKIYTYLISMYEQKREINDTDEYIEFEISDFICGFLGNKMNRNYYSKVEQSLKNLKNTEYQFVVSNHSKLGKYKFEDEEFKLLTYKKLKIGKKVQYRVTLNKNIRKKIKDKRYIKYNSKNLLEILEKDVIASRIYKYISKIRYSKTEDEISIKAIAAIIPLKTVQIVSRMNKKGEKRNYKLNRMKQITKRIEKAFGVLKKLGYIEKYKIKDRSTNPMITYTFNTEKDNQCHISSHLGENAKFVEYTNKWDKVNKKRKELIAKKEEKIEEAEIINDNVHIETTDLINEKIEKAKRNIYVSRAWNKRVDNKISKIFSEFGEKFTIDILNIIYKNLNNEIHTTLVQYINGVVNTHSSKIEQPAKIDKKLQLFEEKEVKKPLKENEEIKEKQNHIFSAEEAEKIFSLLDDIKKIEIEAKALELCEKTEDVSQSFLLQLKQKSEKIYMSTIMRFIAEVLSE